MDHHAAQRSASRIGIITLPIGVVLLAAPTRIARLLGPGQYNGAVRVIGALDLALVPGLLRGRRRRRWLLARAALNLVIAGYCLRLRQRDGGRGAVAAAAVMLAATLTDAPVIAALSRPVTS